MNREIEYLFEVEMAEPTAALARRWWGRKPPDFIAREVVAPGAIADLVGCAFDARATNNRRERGHSPILEWAPLACVSTCEQPLSTREIAARIGMSLSTVQKAVAQAISCGALRRDSGLVSRNPDWHSPARRLVAIELKLTDWRKALRQAEHYSKWADEAWVVMAREITSRMTAAALEAGVGLARLRLDRLQIVATPARRKHERFASSRLLAAEQALAQSISVSRTMSSTSPREWLPALAH